MNEKRKININLAGIPMNITIDSAEEEGYRKAAKEINQRIMEYKSHLGRLDSEEYYYLAATCLEYKLKLQRYQTVNSQLENISRELDEVIS